MGSLTAPRESDEGLTIGERWRRHVARTSSATLTPAFPARHEGTAGPLRFRADRTLAQHDALTAPDLLMVRAALESAIAGATHASAIDVSFGVAGVAPDVSGPTTASWQGTAQGWRFTVARLGDRVSVALTHGGPVAPDDPAEATFRLRTAQDADVLEDLWLRAPGRPEAQNSGARSSDITAPVERLSLQ